MSHSGSWRSGMPDVQLETGLALACYGQQFVRQAADGQVLFPRRQLQRQFAGQIRAEHGVGYWHEQPVYLLQLQHPPAQTSALHSVTARHYMLQGDVDTCRMLGFASQVAAWSDQHQFCGRCAAPMQSDPSHRRRHCAHCGLENYPRITPCMIVLVSRGDEILLARAPRFIPGMYSVLAGHAEPGESIEGCVRREVMEETQIRIQNLRYITSQSWPFPHALMLGFHASYLDGEIVPQADELEDAAWFNIHELPGLPMPGSIARYLIDLHLQQKLGQPQPVLPF